MFESPCLVEPEKGEPLVNYREKSPSLPGAINNKGNAYCSRLRAVSLFLSPSNKTRENAHARTEGARRERHEKRETTGTATDNGLSGSTDFFGVETEI